MIHSSRNEGLPPINEALLGKKIDFREVTPPMKDPSLKSSHFKESEKAKKVKSTRRIKLEQDNFTIEVDKSEDLLLKGDLLRFHPGISYNFIRRSIFLTEGTFRYYKNLCHSIFQENTPLVNIPLEFIVKVQRY